MDRPEITDGEDGFQNGM